MITGCTLIDYKNKYSTKFFFIRRAKKTLIPFIIWSFFSILFAWIQHPDMKMSALHIISGIVHYKYMYIYWFFPPLFAIYLSIPVLADIQNKVKTFTYMAAFGMITFSVFNLLRHSEFANSILPPIYAPICGGYLIYPLLGYVLHHTEQKKLTRILIYTSGLVSTLVHFWVTYTYTPEGGNIFSLFKNYLHITSVLQAMAVFVFVKYRADSWGKNSRVQRSILYLQPAAFGIYLSHQYIIFLMHYLGVDSGSLLYRIPGALCIFLILGCTIRQLQRIKWLRILLP